jgi:hypothetical protein
MKLDCKVGSVVKRVDDDIEIWCIRGEGSLIGNGS